MRSAALAALFIGAAALAGAPSALAQQSFATGQNIAPAYEGWEQNEDGSFNLVFGYMNRNWEEVIDVPVGPDNGIEPGGPDQGQPTHFLPRRNRFVFRIRVPADFGDKELIWTLTTNGQTERAYATLKRDYYIDDLVVQANYGAAGAAGATPESEANEAPALSVEGQSFRTVAAGEPLTLSIFVDEPDGRPARWWVGWAKFSGPGDVRFSQLEMLADYRYENRATTTATFSEPGEYVVLVQSIENIQSFERQCCWTNGYVEVTVTP